MNLLEAKDFFSEIVDNCSVLEGVHFMIALSITPHTVVDGYEIHLSHKKLDEKTLAYLKDLANQKGLYFESRDAAVGIFKMKKGVFA